MEIMFNFFIKNWDKIFMSFAGFIAIFVYNKQKSDERHSAATLIIMQIDDLKNKLPSIIEIVNNNKLDPVGIYETLDFLIENQWNKYKHLFVKDIDINSLRIIDSFYESVSLIREQLVISKNLQCQEFFNNQQFLGQASSMLALQMLLFNNTNRDEVKSMNEKSNENNDNHKDLKETKNKIQLIGGQTVFENNSSQIMNNYYNKMNEIKELFGKQGMFISYLPEQVRITIAKELSKLSHIEIVGSSGYKKLRKIAKIK